MERVLDDMRQCVASRGEEGWVTKAVMLLIRYELLCIIEILLDLLARFRAGKLPPVLPAERAPGRWVGDSPTIDPGCQTVSPRHAVPRPSRAPAATRATAPRDASSNPPEPSAADAPRRPPVVPLFPPRLVLPPPVYQPRGIASHPSQVPRPPPGRIREVATLPTRAHFVTIPY